MVQSATIRPVMESDKGAADGVASLDSSGVLLVGQLPTVSRAKLALDVRTALARGEALLDSDGKIVEAALSAGVIAKINAGGSNPQQPSGTSRVYLTQADYDAIVTKDPTVEYNIVANPPAVSTATKTVYLTQTEYDAISSKDANTEYNITGA